MCNRRFLETMNTQLVKPKNLNGLNKTQHK